MQKSASAPSLSSHTARGEEPAAIGVLGTRRGPVGSSSPLPLGACSMKAKPCRFFMVLCAPSGRSPSSCHRLHLRPTAPVVGGTRFGTSGLRAESVPLRSPRRRTAATSSQSSLLQRQEAVEGRGSRERGRGERRLRRPSGTPGLDTAPGAALQSLAPCRGSQHWGHPVRHPATETVAPGAILGSQEAATRCLLSSCEVRGLGSPGRTRGPSRRVRWGSPSESSTCTAHLRQG
jgi:hypothetical protein